MQNRNTPTSGHIVKRIDIFLSDALVKAAVELAGGGVDPEAVYQQLLRHCLEWLNQYPPSPDEEAIATLTLICRHGERLPVACILDTTGATGDAMFTTFESLTAYVERPGISPGFRAEVLQTLADHYRQEFPTIGAEVPRA